MWLLVAAARNATGMPSTVHFRRRDLGNLGLPSEIVLFLVLRKYA